MAAPALPAQPPTRSRRPARGYLGVAVFAFCLGVLLSALCWQLVRWQVAEKETYRFNIAADLVEAAIAERINDQVKILKGLQGLILARAGIDRAEWQRYVAGLGMTNFRGSLGYAFVRYLHRAEVAPFLAATRADRAPDFALRSAGAADELFVIEMVAPPGPNQAALGYDIGQEASRREAAVGAVVNNRATLSAPVDLLRNEGTVPGFLLLLPVYRSGLPLTTAAERWQALLGWVDGPIRSDQFLAGVADGLPPVDVEIYDGPAAAGARLLYDSDPSLQHRAGAPAPRPGYSRETLLDVAGRPWLLRITPLPGFAQSLDRSLANLLLASGLLLSLLAALLLLVLGRSLRNARNHYRSIVENTDDLIVRVDPEGTLLYVNSAALGFWGVPAAAGVGRSAFDFVIPEERERTRSVFHSWLARGEAVGSFENSVLHSSGRLRRVLWTLSAEYDQRGRASEVTCIGRDITRLRRDKRLLGSQLLLIDYARDHSADELLRRCLDEAEALTDSEIGFYHFVAADQQTLQLQAWSSNTLERMCTAGGAGSHYPISAAGVWADCIRERRSVVHNDYQALAQRRGLPPGHAPVTRELVVPVFRGEALLAVLGVGNKRYEYDEEDVRAVERLADLAWEIVTRKQAQEALAESEARFQAMFRGHNATMLLTDPASGRIVDANQAACDFYGYPLESLRQMHLDRINTLPRLEIESAMAMAVSGALRGFEFRHRLASGEERAVEVHASPIEVEQRTLLFSIIHDITSREVARQALAESEAKYRALFDEAAHGAAVADADTGILLSCNRRLAELVGRPVDELVGKHQRILHPQQPEASGPFTPTFEAHRHQDMGEVLETQLQTRSGEQIDVEIMASRLRIGGRNLLQGFFYDIRQRKQLLEDYRRSTQLAALGTVAAGIAHEVNNPVNGIINCAALIRNAPERTGRVADLARIIIREGERVAPITRDLLHYSRDSRGEFLPTDLRELVASAISLLRLNLADDIEIALDLEQTPLVLELHPQGMQQVVINLVGNACDAVREKGGTAENRVVRVGCHLTRELAEATVCLEVLDFGCGIPAPLLDRVRDAFFTTKPGSRGTGLGLAIVGDIVAKHQGRLEIESEAGVFTRVRVFLPWRSAGKEV